MKGKRSTARFVNGVVSAVIVVFFLMHGVLGSASMLTGFSGPVAGLVWCGVAVVGIHIVISIVTSYQQLADKEFPPSARKKRHLALKWATGILLAAAATAHIVVPKSAAAAALAIVAVSVFLAIHLCVGSKSLLTDLSVDKRYKTAFRIVVCAFAAAFVFAMIAVLAN